MIRYPISLGVGGRRHSITGGGSLTPISHFQGHIIKSSIVSRNQVDKVVMSIKNHFHRYITFQGEIITKLHCL